jgi:succinoglycan biosynthesis transport protein ExoP
MSPREDQYESDRSWGLHADDAEESLQVPAFVQNPLGVLKRRWPWMAAAVVFGLALTAAALWLWKPSYIAHATLLITSQQIPEEFVRSTVRGDTIANVNTMAGTVLSQDNLARVLDKFEMYDEVREKVPRIELIKLMRANVTLAPTTGSSGRFEASLLYGISFEAADPVKAAGVANALAGLFVEASIARRQDQAQRTTEFLTHALERDEQELREQSRRVSEFRQAHRGELPSELETNLRKLEMLATRRESLVTQIAERENQIATLAPIASDQPVTDNEMLLDELRHQLAREVAIHTDDHPNVAALRRQVEQLKLIVAEEDAQKLGPTTEVGRLIASTRRGIVLLESQMEETEAMAADLNARVERAPVIHEQMAALEQAEQVLKENYLDTFRKVEGAELAESLESAQQGAQVSVLDRARPPAEPKRSRPRLAVFGFVATLALSAGLAVLLELVDPVVVSAQQLEGIVELPLLGSLPRIR